MSKSWLVLISSPNFINAHVRKNIENLHYNVISQDDYPNYDSVLIEIPLQSVLNPPVTRATRVDTQGDTTELDQSGWWVLAMPWFA